MPTTPPRSAESDDVRPPCRTAAVTGVPSANSGHCSAIPSTVATLWEPTTPSADVSGTAPATVLPTPRTFSCAEPSTGVGATLGRGTDLDRSKTLANRTLGTPPRHVWRTVPSTATPRRPQEPQGRQRDLCEIKTSPRTTAMTGAIPHSSLPIVASHCTPLIRGEDDDF